MLEWLWCWERPSAVPTGPLTLPVWPDSATFLIGVSGKSSYQRAPKIGKKLTSTWVGRTETLDPYTVAIMGKEHNIILYVKPGHVSVDVLANVSNTYEIPCLRQLGRLECIKVESDCGEWFAKNPSRENNFVSQVVVIVIIIIIISVTRCWSKK